jgi:hypothetical protein
MGNEDGEQKFHGRSRSCASTPHENVGLHVLQAPMRHADLRTTLKVYAHLIPQSQRDSMERIAQRSNWNKVSVGTEAVA